MTTASVLRHRAALDGHDLTISAVMLLTAAAVVAALPHGDGLPCPLRTITGVPCPLCGMTTSVEATVHGNLTGALRANPAGLIIVVAAITAIVIRPKRVWIHTTVVCIAIAAMWLYELWRFGLI